MQVATARRTLSHSSVYVMVTFMVTLIGIGFLRAARP
jgi:hypothetical protein